MPPGGASGGGNELLGWIIILAITGILVALVLAIFWRIEKHRVNKSSIALRELATLNARFRSSVHTQPPIRTSFRETVSSKSTLDRFDLASFMSRCGMDSEAWFDQEVRSRLAATQTFMAYHHDFEAHLSRWSGRSSHPKIKPTRFAAVERKLYQKRKLVYPTPIANVSSSVHYTSPKGQNSYTRRLDWNFEQLQSGLLLAQEHGHGNQLSNIYDSASAALWSRRFECKHCVETTFAARCAGRARRTAQSFTSTTSGPLAWAAQPSSQIFAPFATPATTEKATPS